MLRLTTSVSFPGEKVNKVGALGTVLRLTYLDIFYLDLA